MKQVLPLRQAVTPVVLTLALASLAWYATMVLNPANAGHPVAYAVLLVAEGIGMLQLLWTWTMVLLSPQPVESFAVTAARAALRASPSMAGSVAVFVPVAGEPLAIIRVTAIAARDIELAHRTYILDDGASDDVRNLAAELGVEYIRRASHNAWKAGNVNHALERVHCDFFALFDSDFVAKREFLVETLPYLLEDPRLAFVQTPQSYGNDDAFVAGGSSDMQQVFYRHIQAGKNAFNAAFCVGTNVLFRAAAVRDVGGLYERSHSEDIWTSLLLHERGWRSFYLPHILAVGHAPETFEGYFRQQFRWARGAFEILFRHNPLFSRSLTLDQKIQYLHSAMFFLSGFSIAAFFILPLLYAYLGWQPLDVGGSRWTWAAHAIPYLSMILLSMVHLSGRRLRWRTFVVALSAFPAHILSCLSALTGLRSRWNVSGVVSRDIDYIKSVAIHILLMLLSLGAIPVLLATPGRDVVVSQLMTFWLALNSALLFSVCKRAIPRFDPEQRKRAAAARREASRLPSRPSVDSFPASAPRPVMTDVSAPVLHLIPDA